MAELYLDVGCGVSDTLPQGSEGMRVVGLDPSFASLRRANTGKRLLVCGRAEQLPFASDAFISLQSIHVIEHLKPESVSSALGEMQRVLIKGGSARLAVPHPYYENIISALVGRDLYFSEKMHRQVFSSQHFARAISEAGFNVNLQETRGWYQAAAVIGIGVIHKLFPKSAPFEDQLGFSETRFNSPLRTTKKLVKKAIDGVKKMTLINRTLDRILPFETNVLAVK